jgi:hypothetical protein
MTAGRSREYLEIDNGQIDNPNVGAAHDKQRRERVHTRTERRDRRCRTGATIRPQRDRGPNGPARSMTRSVLCSASENYNEGPQAFSRCGRPGSKLVGSKMLDAPARFFED